MPGLFDCRSMDNSYYWPETQEAAINKDSPFLVPPCYFPPWGFSQEDTSRNASRSHSEAEKRRRDRINAQLSTLRKLIPSSEKTDKAGLLRRVVDHVKDLKVRAKEISKLLNTAPSDIDEVIIEEEDKKKKSIFIKASLCCDDRPELFSEINRGLHSLKLTIVEADVTCLGGRVKCVFVLSPKVEDATTVSMNSLRHSLRLLLNRIVASPSTSNYRIKSKRQRFFLPPNFS